MHESGDDLAVLLVHRPGPTRTAMAAALKAVGLQPQLVDSGPVALEALRGNRFVAIIASDDLGPTVTAPLLEQLHDQAPGALRVLLRSHFDGTIPDGVLVFEASDNPDAVAEVVARDSRGLETGTVGAATVEVLRVFGLPMDPDRNDAVTAQLGGEPATAWVDEVRRIGAETWASVEAVGRMLLCRPVDFATSDNLTERLEAHIAAANEAASAGRLTASGPAARSRATTIKIDP